MAWTGEVSQRIVAVTPTGPQSSEILFECRHRQNIAAPAPAILRQFRALPCDACSEPHRQRILEIQTSISFDDVVSRIRDLARDEKKSGD